MFSQESFDALHEVKCRAATNHEPSINKTGSVLGLKDGGGVGRGAWEKFPNNHSGIFPKFAPVK